MKLGVVFKWVRNNDIRRINDEYLQIRQKYDDMFIGTQMMQNDLSCNIELWAEIEQAVIILFQNIERGSLLKKKIIEHLHLTTDTPQQPIEPPPYKSYSTKNSLEIRALSFYIKAYKSVVYGDTETFRKQALDYRIISGLEYMELCNLLQYLKELLYYVELDEINVKHLWNIYQKDCPQNIEELLHEALVNHIFQNEAVYVEAYLKCVSAITDRLKEVV